MTFVPEKWKAAMELEESLWFTTFRRKCRAEFFKRGDVARVLKISPEEAGRKLRHSAYLGLVSQVGGWWRIPKAQHKFGSASSLFDGVGDYLSMLDSADWRL